MFSELTNNFQYKNLFEEPSTNYVIIVNIEWSSYMYVKEANIQKLFRARRNFND